MPAKRPRIAEETEELPDARPRTGAPGGAPPRRRPGAEAASDNRRRLGVDQEHRTETMRRRGRGTFP